MYEFDVNPALLLALVAGVLALAFDYFPKLATWFDALTDSQKKLLNVGLILGTAVVLFAGDCFALFATNLVCDTKGAIETLHMVFLAIAVNQGVHLALKPSPWLKAKVI